MDAQKGFKSGKVMDEMDRTDGEPQVKGVNVLDPKQLLQLAQNTTEAGRYQLAGAISQFFDDMELNETEQKLISDILMSLIRQAEIDLREALSERLSVQDNIPTEVIVFLANDVISVAKPILLHSPVLKESHLMRIIASRGEEHWRSIAGRKQLSPAVVERLIETSEPKTVLALVDNQSATFQRSDIKKLIRISLQSEALQVPLLRRPEIDGDIAGDLYMCVSQALQREIIERFCIPPSVIEDSLEALVSELVLEAKESQMVTSEIKVLAKRFRERGDISPELMIKTLRRGQVSFFIALFSERVGLSPEAVMQLVQKEGSKPFALACRSIGMMKSEFASLFLLSRGIRTSDKIVDQRELAMALKYYDSMKDFEVQRIMRIWMKNPDMI